MQKYLNNIDNQFNIIHKKMINIKLRYLGKYKLYNCGRKLKGKIYNNIKYQKNKKKCE